MDSISAHLLPLLLYLCVNNFKGGISKCSEGNITLDNRNELSMIMVCSGGKWSYLRTIQNQWNSNEVAVVCQQLGYLVKESKSYIYEYYSNEISFCQTFFCTGMEKKLIDCSHSDMKPLSSCYYKWNYGYAGVFCNTSAMPCTAGTIKLEGDILKICAKGKWHTLCGDYQSWTTAQADVACRQLRLNPMGASPTNISAYGIESKVDIRFHCNGEEQSLSECSASLVTCQTNNVVAGLICGEWPASPNNVTINSFTSSVKLFWSSDTENVMFFNISCKNNQHTIQIVISSDINNTTINGLLPHSNYTCCVSIVNNEGESKPVCKNVSVTTNITSNKINMSSSSASVSWIVGILVGIILGILITVAVWVGVLVYDRKYKAKKPTMNIKTSNNSGSSLLNPTYDNTSGTRPEYTEVSSLPVLESDYAYTEVDQPVINVYDAVKNNTISNDTNSDNVYSLTTSGDTNESQTYSKLQRND